MGRGAERSLLGVVGVATPHSGLLCREFPARRGVHRRPPGSCLPSWRLTAPSLRGHCPACCSESSFRSSGSLVFLVVWQVPIDELADLFRGEAMRQRHHLGAASTLLRKKSERAQLLLSQSSEPMSEGEQRRPTLVVPRWERRSMEMAVNGTADTDCTRTGGRMRAGCSEDYRSQVSRTVAGFGSTMARIGSINAAGGL